MMGELLCGRGAFTGRISLTSLMVIAAFFNIQSWSSWGKKGLTAGQLLVLIDWIPNLGEITALRISTQDKCNPNTCKQIIKKCE